jgi:membrane protein
MGRVNERVTQSRVGLFVRALFRRLGAIDFANEAMLFGAGVLISVVPFMILLSAFASESVDEEIALHLGLDHQAADIVSHLFNQASPTVSVTTAISLLFVVAGTIAVVGSLLQIYEKVFNLPHRGRRDFARIVVWTVGMCAGVALVSVVDRAAGRAPYGVLLVEAVMFSGVTVFVWWTMHYMLAGRVTWRRLWPSALATGIFTLGLSVFSKLYFSDSIVSDDRTYGPIGAIFSIMTWLIAIGAVLLMGAVTGPAWEEARAAR